MKTWMIVLIVVLVLAVIIFFVMKKKSSEETQPQQAVTVQPQSNVWSFLSSAVPEITGAVKNRQAINAVATA
jgi:hypothetical protein